MKVASSLYTTELRSMGLKGLIKQDSCGSEEIRVFAADSSFRKGKGNAVHKEEPGKSVRFLVDGEDAILADVHTFQKYSQEDRNDIFWPPSAKTKFLTNARYDCNNVALGKAELLENLDDIYCMVSDNDEETTRCMRKWVNSVGRGLESALVKSVRQRRKRHNKAVLKCQQKNWERDTSIESMMNVLRKQSRKSSQKAANFARLLARGDEYAVREVVPCRRTRVVPV